MAVDDVGFYNLIGEEVTRSSLVNEMIDFYTLKLEAGETRVTDFNEGSEIRNLLEAFAVDLYVLMEEQNELTSIGFVDSAEGEWLDKHGANPLINLPRDTGHESTGFVTFSIPAALTEEVVIPDGTLLLAEEEDLEFVTNGDGVISIGDTSVTVAVDCLTVGEDGNLAAGSINLIDDDYIDINGLTVTNANDLTNGTDYEEDDEYRQRLLEYNSQDDFGSLGYYTRLCESVEGVHDVSLINYTGYTKKILVNGDVKPCPSTVVANVQSKVSEPDNIVLGHSFIVNACGTTSVSLTVNLTVNEALDNDELTETIQAFFNGGNGGYVLSFDGLMIDEAVTHDKLADVFYMIDSVESVSITDGTDPITTLTPTTNTVLKLTSVTFNQTQS